MSRSCRWTELGVRNTEAGFDAISLGLIANGDTTAGLSLNTNGHNGDCHAALKSRNFTPLLSIYVRYLTADSLHLNTGMMH